MNLDAKLDLNLILRERNLVNHLSEQDVQEIGSELISLFETDKTSRHDWEQRNEKALNLAMQVAKHKTFPWPDASNVKFPLVTIGALQFHSRAYPALINGPTPVACRNMEPAPEEPMLPQMPQLQPGQQPTPDQQQAIRTIQQAVAQYKAELRRHEEGAKRAKRIAGHMSYQILEEVVDWEEEMDKLLLVVAITGCAFKKVYHDAVSGQHRSICVNPRDLVVSYYTKSLATAPRISHILYMNENEVEERVRRGVFSAFPDGDAPPPMPDRVMQDPANERQGITPPPNGGNPYEMIEMHCWLDLDGDGYNEPYVVTIRRDTKQVMRIVARFVRSGVTLSDDRKKPKVLRIEPETYFIKYPLVPSPDGGFYDLGFGSLLGPINDSVDTILNQLIDAGSLQTAGGGFLGRGFKSKRGNIRRKLGEWIQTDSGGDDLRKSIVPFQDPAPSPVLFNCLTLLIEYGQQVAGAVDIMQGKNPGQNTPAETSRTMVEQGMKVFNGIYKRIHRSFTQELRLWYRLNQTFLEEEGVFFSQTASAAMKIFKADYSGRSAMIKPAADPFYMSDTQRMQTAMVIHQTAHSVPGWNTYQANLRLLDALRETDPASLVPDPKGPNAIPPRIPEKVQIEQIKAQEKVAATKAKMQIVQMQLGAEANKTQAEIVKLMADAHKAMAEANGVDTGHKIALIQAAIEAKKNHHDHLLKMAELLQPDGEKDGNQSE